MKRFLGILVLSAICVSLPAGVFAQEQDRFSLRVSIDEALRFFRPLSKPSVSTQPQPAASVPTPTVAAPPTIQPEPTPQMQPPRLVDPQPQPTPKPTPSERGGMVSFDLDDGWTSNYEALSIFDRAGIRVTYYPVSQYFGFEVYITTEQLKSVAARGHQIGAHSRTHADLTQLSESAARDEIAGSRADLQALGHSVSTFAYPYGALNPSVRKLAQQAGFSAARGTNHGYIDATTDRYNLPAYDIDGMTFAQVKDIIDGARAQNAWVILLLHKVDAQGDPWSISSATLQQIVDYVKAQNIETVTTAEGIQRTF